MQRLLRAKRFTFRKFGPLIFTRYDGSAAAFGRLHFLKRGSSVPYIVLGRATEPRLLAMFVLRHWLVGATAQPELLISVSGSAQDFQMDDRVQRSFSAGLASWARHGRSLFITAGTSSGVNKLVAETLSAAGMATAPVLGVSTFECVAQRDRLADNFIPGNAREVAYPECANNAWAAALDACVIGGCTNAACPCDAGERVRLRPRRVAPERAARVRLTSEQVPHAPHRRRDGLGAWRGRPQRPVGTRARHACGARA